MKKYFLIIITILLNFTATAQLAGTLNTAFSQDGYDDTFFGGNPGLAFPVTETIIQPDGKILICVGANVFGEPQQAVITRYNPNGTVDLNFGGGDGTVRSKEDLAIDLYIDAIGMTIQNNGKIVIAGNNFGTPVIFRLNADGSFDTTFATNGAFQIMGGDLEVILDVFVQSDNKIIVCGEESIFVNGVIVGNILLWRFTENGILDTTFGNAGEVSYNNSNWLNGDEIYLRFNDLIVFPDDKIIINLSYNAGSSSFVMLRKLNSNGALETSFGTNGAFIKSESITAGEFIVSSSSTRSNGSIVSTCTTLNSTNSTYTQSLFRITNQGVLDTSFNVNLDNPTNFPEIIQIVASGDKIYVFKKTTTNPLTFDEIHCLDLNGNPVTAFGTNGIAIINQNNIPESRPGKAAIASNGNIYIASNLTASNGDEMFFISNINGFDPNLSTNDLLKENNTTVFPNPSTGIFTIKSESNIENTVISIYDLNGRELFSVKSEKLNNQILELSSLQNGVYILNILDGNNKFSKKLVKR